MAGAWGDGELPGSCRKSLWCSVVLDTLGKRHHALAGLRILYLDNNKLEGTLSPDWQIPQGITNLWLNSNQ